MKLIKILSFSLSVILFISCGEPQDEVIDVISREVVDSFRMIYGEPVESSVKVGDLEWEQLGGFWIARDQGIEYQPMNLDALEAIENYMEGKYVIDLALPPPHQRINNIND